MPEGEEVQTLGRWLRECARGVVFTGAGISTESGIPDFRSPGGIWSRYKPVEFADFVSSEEARRQAWRRTFATRPLMAQARPNAGHLAIAQLVERGVVSHVITQNIDGLHQRSGVPEDRVVELHGNATYAACLSCRCRYDLDDLQRRFEPTETPPTCLDCGGLVKTATVSFGQAMPVREMQRAEAATLRCDLFVAMGSSLVVFPAAGFPALAKRSGAKLVIINRDPTDLDPIADLLIHGEIGAALSAAVPSGADG